MISRAMITMTLMFSFRYAMLQKAAIHALVASFASTRREHELQLYFPLASNIGPRQLPRRGRPRRQRFATLAPQVMLEAPAARRAASATVELAPEFTPPTTMIAAQYAHLRR